MLLVCTKERGIVGNLFVKRLHWVNAFNMAFFFRFDEYANAGNTRQLDIYQRILDDFLRDFKLEKDY